MAKESMKARDAKRLKLINKYKANIYTDFTISSFHHPTTHNPLKSTATLAPSPTLPKPHYPSKNAITLASLVKGEVLSPEKIRATTGGIVLRSHNPSKTTSTPRPAPPHLAPLSKGAGLRQGYFLL